MAWQVGEQFHRYLSRSDPGPGAGGVQDDGSGSTVKNKSIPNVATSRLHRSLDAIHEQVHTGPGLRAHDQPRRSLIEMGAKGRMIAHELRLRGEPDRDCRFCR